MSLLKYFLEQFSSDQAAANAPPVRFPLEKSEEPLRPPRRLTFAALRKLKQRLPLPAAVLIARQLCVTVSAGDDDPFVPLTDEGVWLMSDGSLRVAQRPKAPGPRRLRSVPFCYVTPEGARAMPTDARSTVFSIAVLLWELITGKRLFHGSDYELLMVVVEGQVPSRPAGMPVALYEVFTRALSRNPDDRYASPAVLAAALAPLQEHFGPSHLRALIAELVPESPPLAPKASGDEGRVLAAIAQGDESARLVYADLLLDLGYRDEARWLQLEHEVRTLEGEAQLGALEQLRTLGKSLSTAFIASVARPQLEGCAVRFGFECPLKWSTLAPTARPGVRWCSGCHSEVHYCRDLEQAQQLAGQGACIAVDVTVPRAEGDLNLPDPDRVVMGKY